MANTNNVKWDKRYLDLSAEISKWSKDPSTKVGAITVGSKGQILSQGYNGFPRGIKDTGSRLNNREKKYSYTVHAEQNAIYNATYNGVSLDGATMYIHGLPVCSECAKGIIQVGIKRVVMTAGNYPERWVQSFKQTSALFDEVGIVWELIKRT